MSFSLALMDSRLFRPQFELLVANSDTGAKVKEMIREAKGIPKDQIRLLFAGYQLHDGEFIVLKLSSITSII